jgi:hypothetical protein
VFITPVTSGGNTRAVDVFTDDRYTTVTSTLDSGLFDFDYPGLPKILLDVTVITEPLPGDTTVTLSYAVDRGSFVAATGTHNVDGATTFTFTISSTATTVIGREFELRLHLDTDQTTNTPTIREVSARATGAAHTLEWILQLDTSDIKSGFESSDVLINALNTLATNRAVVSFSDPWQNRESDDPETFDVTVEEVVTPASQSSDPPAATVRLRAVSLV